MKLLVIGGNSGKHIWMRQNSPNWEIAGIVAQTDETLNECGKKFDIPENLRFKDIDVALENQIVIQLVTVPNWLHYEMSKKVLLADKHLIIEKPLTDTWEEAVDLLKLANSKTELESMVGQTLRGDVMFRMIEHIIKEGVIGHVESLTFRSHTFWLNDPAKSWRYTLPNMFLDDIGIHHFDAIRMFLSNRRCESVMSMLQRPKSYPLEINTTCSSSMKFTDNIMVNYFGSVGTKGHSVGWKGDATIFGDKGSIVKPENGAPYVVYESKEKVDVEDIIGDDLESVIPLIEYSGIAFLLEDFYHAIKDKRDPVTDLQDNMFSHKMLVGHKLSAEEGREVVLENEFPF